MLTIQIVPEDIEKQVVFYITTYTKSAFLSEIGGLFTSLMAVFKVFTYYTS